MPTPRQEIVRRFAQLVYSAKTLTGADEVIIALDSAPYKRAEFYSNWYKSHALQTPNGRYLKIDGAVIPTHFERGEWSVEKPLTIKQRKELKIDELEFVTIGEKFYKFLPTYKQGRNKQALVERLDLTLDEYYETQKNAIERACEFFGAIKLQVEGWEADDVVGVLSAKLDPKKIDKLTLVSRDKDWQQLALRSDGRVQVLDLTTGKFSTLTENKTEITELVRAKIIGGDTSDHIRGLPKSETQCFGKTTADKLAVNPIDPELLNSDEGRRNLELIVLPTPSWDLETAWKTLNKKAVFYKPNGDLESVYLREPDVREISDRTKIGAFIQRLKGDVQK